MTNRARVGTRADISDPEVGFCGNFTDAELAALERANVDWFWRTDAEHHFTWISDSFYDFLGLPRGAWTGSSRLVYLGSLTEMDAVVAAHARDLDARRPFRDLIYPLHVKDGGTYWISSTGIPEFDADGAFTGYYGSGRNVTGALARFDDLEKARRQLAGNNVILSEAFSALSAGLVVFGADDRLIMQNRRMGELYPGLADILTPGVSLRAVIEATFKEQESGESTPGDIDERRRAFVERQMAGLWRPSSEGIHETDGGRWVHALNRRLDDGTLIALRIDMTSLKQREMELARALDRAKIAEETINGVREAIFVKDEAGRYVFANRSFTELLGLEPESVIGSTDFELVSHDDAVAYRNIDDRVLGTGEPFEFEEMFARPNGIVATNIVRKNCICAPTGKRYLSGLLLDITAQKAQEASLAQARDALQEALNEVNNYKFALDKTAIVAFHDAEMRITYVNDRFCEITGYSRDDVIGASFVAPANPVHPQAFFDAIRSGIGSGDVWQGEICNVGKDGRTWWAETTIVPLTDTSGRIARYVVVCYDISARKAAEEQMRKAEAAKAEAMAILKDVIDTVPDGIVAYDPDGRLVFHNKAYKEIYRLSAPSIRKGAHYSSIMRYGLRRGQFPEAGRTPEEREAWLNDRLRARVLKRYDAIQKIDRGRWVQLRDRRSQSGYIVGVRTDITAQRHAEAEIRRYAETDDLTGADNRKAFYARMSKLLHSGASGKTHALAVFDLDRFKEINDTLGHDAGDRYIHEVVRRLTAGSRKRDIVARLGGDEFAVVMTGLSGAEHAADRIARLRATFREPMVLGGEILKPSASVGVALFPQDATELTELMKAADTALYEAKSSGRDRCAFYEPRLGEERRHRHDTALKLVSAIDRNEIVVALQPQVDLQSGRLAGFEALARWRRGNQIIMPSAFIDVATEHGLIVPLGHAVLEQSIAAIRRMIDSGVDPVQVAVNIAGPQLKLEGFAERVAALLARYDVEPSRLEIEITEAVLLDRSSELIDRALRELRACGVTLALDDFGTGYASLSHLKQFKVDRLKIDRSFIQNVGKDPENTAISLAIIDLASSFGMEVVAEGIETPEQFEFLRSHGCRIGQGYLFGRPDWPEAFHAGRDWFSMASVA